MSNRSKPIGLIVAATLTAWAAAQGSAQPPEGAPKKAEGAQPAPKGLTPPPGLTPEPFTAFPDLKLPMREMPGQKNPDGTAMMVPDTDRLFQRLMALSTRPVPANASLLKKVRAAQVYEACQYLSKLRARIAEGEFATFHDEESFATLGDFYRAAIELEDTPAGKFALAEDRMLVYRVPEVSLEREYKPGDPYFFLLNRARLQRLQAEAEFLTAPPPGVAPKNREMPRTPLIDVTPPPGLSPNPFTAFPDLKFPMRERAGQKNRDGTAEMEPDFDRPLQRLMAIAARPVPADAPLLRKVRIAQLNEGLRYARMFANGIDIGFTNGTELSYLTALSDVYGLAGELEETAAGKAALAEDCILAYRMPERVLERWVESDPKMSHFLNLVRFYRLQAEAAFLIAFPPGTVPKKPEMPLQHVGQAPPPLRDWPDSFTAFPDLKLPMRELAEFKHPDGTAVKVPDMSKLEQGLQVIMTRPVPANASLLWKVRAAQIPEWIAYDLGYQNRSAIKALIFCGKIEFLEHVAILDEVYRAAVDLEDSAVGKVMFAEDRIMAFRGYEWYIELRVRNAKNMPTDLAFVRFHRLQAEADLLRLKADLKAKK